MSVCIAATCSELDGSQRIVLCRDWRGEVPEVGSSDSVIKLSHLSKEWMALLAGDTSRADELSIRYEYYLRDNTLTERNLTTSVRKVFHEYKRELADSYLKTQYGISFDQLVSVGKDKLGEQFTTECFDSISRLRVGAELIIAGFVEVSDYVQGDTIPHPVLCAVSENHDGDVVVSEQDFAVIGAGCNAARTMLFYREQDMSTPVMETIYNVIEAKTISTTVPGIGDTLSLNVMNPDHSLSTLTQVGYDRCVKLFSRFGPRSRQVRNRKKWFELKPEYLDNYKIIEEPSSPAPPQSLSET